MVLLLSPPADTGLLIVTQTLYVSPIIAPLHIQCSLSHKPLCIPYYRSPTCTVFLNTLTLMSPLLSLPYIYSVPYHTNPYVSPIIAPLQVQWCTAGGVTGLRGPHAQAAWTAGRGSGPGTGHATTRRRRTAAASVTATRCSGRTAPSPAKVRQLTGHVTAACVPLLACVIKLRFHLCVI